MFSILKSILLRLFARPTPTAPVEAPPALRGRSYDEGICRFDGYDE